MYFDGSTKITLVNLIVEFKKPKIDHNSLNNGVRAVLTPFSDFQFFNFLPDNPFSKGKNQILIAILRNKVSKKIKFSRIFLSTRKSNKSIEI